MLIEDEQIILTLQFTAHSNWYMIYMIY